MTDATLTDTTLALKEWGAVVHALLDGRQTVLLRKGGIREKRFEVGADAFLLLPTVAHAHAERVRGGHDDVLAAGAADVDEDAATLTVRAGVEVVDVVPATDADGIAALTDTHIWRHGHVAERLAFRPRHPLHVLVVRARPLTTPVTLPRRDAYVGCVSWVDLPVAWSVADPVLPDDRLAAVAARVRAAVA